MKIINGIEKEGVIKKVYKIQRQFFSSIKKLLRIKLKVLRYYVF